MEIGKYVEMKQEKIKSPDLYLGGCIRQVELDNGVKVWAFGSSQYVHAAVKNVEEYLKKHSKKHIPKKGHMNPLTSNYRPEIDISPELDPQDGSYYQYLIGIL